MGKYSLPKMLFLPDRLCKLCRTFFILFSPRLSLSCLLSRCNNHSGLSALDKSCLAYGLTATSGLCTCYYWFVAYKYLLLTSLTDYGGACSNVGYGTFRDAAILRNKIFEHCQDIVGIVGIYRG